MKSMLLMVGVALGLTILSLTQASAADLKSRQVIGGDLIYSASAMGATQQDAIFQAESQAVRMITIECAIAHRDTKIFDFSVNPVGDKFSAHVSAGLPLESCEEGRQAGAEQKIALTNPLLASSQRVYEEKLQGKVQAPPMPLRLPSPAQQQEYRVRVIYSQSFLRGYDRYLNAKVDQREVLRTQIRNQLQ